MCGGPRVGACLMYLETSEETAMSGVKLARGDCFIILGEILKALFYNYRITFTGILCVCI